MRERFKLILILTLLAVVGCKAKLRSQNEKASYAIGQQMVQNMREQNLELDVDALTLGIRDSYKKTNQLSAQEMQQALLAMQQQASTKQSQEAEVNGKAAREFLEKNKANSDIKVTKSGLQYVVEKPGTGPTPKAQDTVKCHYRGTLLSGAEFDSSYGRGQPAEFPVTGVLKAWTEALQMMKVGEKIKCHRNWATVPRADQIFPPTP
jgi:FKBP-type peptidyl-prolyl cis-trans isomerase